MEKPNLFRRFSLWRYVATFRYQDIGQVQTYILQGTRWPIQGLLRIIEDRQIRNCSVDEDYFSITTFYALLPQISIQHYQIIKQEYRRASISLTSPYSIYSYVNNYDIHHDLYIPSDQLQQYITVKVRLYYFYHDSIPSQL